MSGLLNVHDLCVRYPLRGGPVDVVLGVSLDVHRGRTLAVVGESGSGKTTLAMALCGLVPLAAGEVRFDGEELARDRHGRLVPDRKRLALMFQDAVGSLSPRMTVRSILAEPRRMHGPGPVDADQEALRLLSLVGLGDEIADRFPHQLSGGQARRVCLARALALGPDLLIADEPTAGLDVSVQGEVLNLLARVQRESGLGILVITHNLNVVRHVADDMAIMYLGRFIEQGDSARIFSAPRHPYTAALLSASPGPDPQARRDRIELAGEVPSLRNRPTGCEFHTRCPRARTLCTVRFAGPTQDAGPRVFHCHFPMD